MCITKLLNLNKKVSLNKRLSSRSILWSLNKSMKKIKRLTENSSFQVCPRDSVTKLARRYYIQL